MPAFKKHFDPNLVRRWVKALRSGRYKQVSGFLSDSSSPQERNCCLGVACRVARVPRSTWEEHGYLHVDPTTEELRKKLGITRNMEKTLVRKNDNGVSFPKIADFIETELL